jgi:diacylglycerol diphosphate phosphatase/phosphatidate phosphatase
MISYRSVYAAIFDFRFNHIPLPPFDTQTQFSYFNNVPHLVSRSLSDCVLDEDDNLVVWSWWKQSGASDQDQKKDIAWLRSIRSMRETGREMGHENCESGQPISMAALVSLSRSGSH